MGQEGEDETGGGDGSEVGIEGAGVDLQDIVGVPIDYFEFSTLELLIEVLLEYIHFSLVTVLQPLLDQDCRGTSVQQI